MGRPKIKTPKVQPTLMKITEDYNPEEIKTSEIGGIEARNREYDLLAEHFVMYVDVERIMELVK